MGNSQGKFKTGLPSTTRTQVRTPQANGGGKV
nr:MAG TPA_asm: hypothetical protein [Caudoviricetes sp.]DAT96046.1 MAG TPA: hypothetical protein [Caudoviricetes sp.]DAZ32439.1 MAG TPA: hypothetical protein [Caudoviricetes sp.]